MADDIPEKLLVVGMVPPTEETILRRAAGMEPYLHEPGSPDWKSVDTLSIIGHVEKK